FLPILHDHLPFGRELHASGRPCALLDCQTLPQAVARTVDTRSARPHPTFPAPLSICVALGPMRTPLRQVSRAARPHAPISRYAAASTSQTSRSSAANGLLHRNKWPGGVAARVRRACAQAKHSRGNHPVAGARG